MNSIGACPFTQIGNSPPPSWSWTELEDGKKGKKRKIKLAHVLELACGSRPKQQYRYDQDMGTPYPNFARSKRQSTRLGTFSLSVHHAVGIVVVLSPVSSEQCFDQGCCLPSVPRQSDQEGHRDVIHMLLWRMAHAEVIIYGSTSYHDGTLHAWRLKGT